MTFKGDLICSFSMFIILFLWYTRTDLHYLNTPKPHYSSHTVHLCLKSSVRALVSFSHPPDEPSVLWCEIASSCNKGKGLEFQGGISGS